jgi:hypothetical protein
MQKAKHSLQFKEQALNKARQRGKQTLETVAADLNMSLATLKGWLKTKPQSESLTPLPCSLPDSRPASQWSAAERLLALHETHTLSGTALHAWCREKGLFAHQLSAWREAFAVRQRSVQSKTRASPKRNSRHCRFSTNFFNAICA